MGGKFGEHPLHDVIGYFICDSDASICKESNVPFECDRVCRDGVLGEITLHPKVNEKIPEVILKFTSLFGVVCLHSFNLTEFCSEKTTM